MNTSTNLKFKKEDSFEEAIEKLESIVNLLDEGTLSLDKTLALYEEGIHIYRYCNDQLDKSEQKIQILMNGKETSFELSDE
ncbi:exodeoxyribonuclease VII small subunit [Inediibacterium massiliense]|uniref:exodeoxyribonuclease VII small subunit n=1 Tax=Inediibacterium massiliense TaxID=1658111 RepID=UPI0006B68CFB|nr:exodeoxyribonuclease VII small subunit [Inediibacterium massiliense]